MKVRPSAGPGPLRALVLVMAAAALGGCGTPAALRPAATPLPGLPRAVQAARNAVVQSQQQASGSTVTTP